PPAYGARAPLITPRPRLLLFDLDDTLCDYATARDQRRRIAFRHALAHRSHVQRIDIDQLVIDSIAIDPHDAEHFGDLLRRHGVDDPTAAATAAAWYRTHRFHGLSLFADAEATLATLRSSLSRPDGRIGLITNGPTEVQRAKIELLQIARLVDFIIISEEFGHWKPDLAIFAEALRLGEATAREAIFIGDSVEHDMAGARTAGIRSVWVNRTGRPWVEPEPPPDFQITALGDLPRLLGVTSNSAP
ncbi:MAG TPA: HAD family hydrolase, partial [Thermomicrobiales bacterium]|nr:HAD family hydrolase [Thermomicrobiales bacterium]